MFKVKQNNDNGDSKDGTYMWTIPEGWTATASGDSLVVLQFSNFDSKRLIVTFTSTNNEVSTDTMIVHFSNEAWTPTTTASMLRKADDNPIINSGTMQDEVNVYPNPSADFVNVRLPSDIKNDEISILDLSGKVLFIEMANSNIVNINTLLLSNGIFMIRIQTGETFLI